jgi:hypothetical protein
MTCEAGRGAGIVWCLLSLISGCGEEPTLGPQIDAGVMITADAGLVNSEVAPALDGAVASATDGSLTPPDAGAPIDSGPWPASCKVCGCLVLQGAPDDCSYDYPFLPESIWRDVSPSSVSVEQAGASVPRVQDADACAAIGAGWYFDTLAAPRAFTLCPDSCGRLREGETVTVFSDCRAPIE